MELDPNFALAHRALAGVYGRLGQPGRMAENIRKAYALRDWVSERERFYIEASYLRGWTGELEKAIPAYSCCGRHTRGTIGFTCCLPVFTQILGSN